MRFFTFVVKNLTRRPLRSGLTVFSVAIAVGAVVALVGIASGFERTFLQLYENVGIDLIVVRAGVRQRLTSTLDEQLAGPIGQVAGVKEVIPGLVDVVSFEEAGLYGVVVQGWAVKFLQRVTIVEGRSIRDGDGRSMMLGSILAANLEKKVGDRIELFENEPFEVVGIFESRTVFENGCMLVELSQLQRLMDRPGQVTGFSVLAEHGPGERSLSEIRRDIEQVGRGMKAMPVREHVETLAEIRAARAMAWMTSAVAILVGTAGMLNTMVMSVHERTNEIGILRALGWRQRRVVRMVLSESMTLSLVGAVVGTLGAMALVWLLTQLPTTSGVIDGRVPGFVVGQGFAIALIVGLCGGLTAACSAARMLPTAALRHI